MFNIRLTLSLGHTGTLRTRSLLMSLLGVGCVLGTYSLSSDASACAVLRWSYLVLMAHLLHERVVILFKHFIRIL